MEKGARFIIKDDKFSLIIIHLIDINKKKYKGITIYKKTLEIDELNEDNINMALAKKDKLIYSNANVGLIKISGIKCFMYCTEKDVKEVGIISFTNIYQILNINYIILEEMDANTNAKLLDFFKEHSKAEVNKGLFFGQDEYNMNVSFDIFFHHLYEMNKNVCHINPNINFCYNNDNISYLNKYGLKNFTTSVICGYFCQNIVNTPKKEEFITNLIVKNKVIQNDSFIKNNELKEIEVIVCPNNNIFLNQIFHIIFYCFFGYLDDAKLILYDVLKKDQSPKRTDNGPIIVIDLDNDFNRNSKDKPKIKDKDIENDLNQILQNNNKAIIIHKKNEIQKNIKKNKKLFDEIKYNYEYKGDDFILEFQEKQLLIITENYEHLNLIMESILNCLSFKFLDNQVELKIKIKSSIKENFGSFNNFLNAKSSNLLNEIKLKIDAINEKYIINNNINKNLIKNLTNEEKQSNKELNKEENKIGASGNNIIINDNNETNNIDSKNKIDQNKNNLYIYIVTFNAASYNFDIDGDDLNNLNKLLFPKDIEKLYNEKGFPTFYVIGLQEIVKLNTSNVIFDSNKSSSYLWETKITEILLKSYNYTLQYKENMVGILLLIFVKSNEAKEIKNCKKSMIKAGFMNTLGNKGYILYEFKYKEKTFAFGSGHLTAGENEKNFKNRANLLVNILNHKSDKNANKFHENNFYFLFGDMNFRVKIDKKNFLDRYEEIKDANLKNRITDDSKILNKESSYKLQQKYEINIVKKSKNKKHAYSLKKLDIYKLNSFKDFNEDDSEEINFSDLSLMAKRKIDQLRYKYFFAKEHLNLDELNGLKKNLVQYNTTENEINFLPTYKYIKKNNYYDLSKRNPAWTDRILFKNSENIRCIKYDKINIKISDHRPVFGLFEIKV